jgi:hypothetical protein
MLVPDKYSSTHCFKLDWLLLRRSKNYFALHRRKFSADYQSMRNRWLGDPAANQTRRTYISSDKESPKHVQAKDMFHDVNIGLWMPSSILLWDVFTTIQISSANHTENRRLYQASESLTWIKHRVPLDVDVHGRTVVTHFLEVTWEPLFLTQMPVSLSSCIPNHPNLDDIMSQNVSLNFPPLPLPVNTIYRV